MHDSARKVSYYLIKSERTVVEEEEHGKAQRGRGQQDQADVAGDHEVAHHKGHLVLVAALLVSRQRRGIVAPTHAPIQRPPPPQAGGDDGTWWAARGAQGPVGENGGGGVGGTVKRRR